MAEASGLQSDSSLGTITWTPRCSGALARAGVIVGLGALYFTAGKVGLGFATIHPSATAVWAPTGIALTACLIFGRWVAAVVFGAAFVLNLTTAGSVTTSLGIAAGNTLEALVGSCLIEHFANGRKVFDRTQDVFRFLLLAAMASTAIAATLGVTSLCLGSYAKWSDSPWIWLTWWLGDAAGDLIVAPLLLLWTATPAVTWDRQRTREAVVLAVALVVTGGVVFDGWLPLPNKQYPLDFFCFPVLLWAAFRFGPRETATASFILSAIAIVGTLKGFGPFAQGTRNEALLLLQTFAGLTGLMSIGVATAVAERQRLDETRSRLAAIVDSSEEGIIGLNLDGYITSWNRSAAQMFGFSTAEVIGQPLTQILPPQQPAAKRELISQFDRNGAIHHFETTRRRKDGSLIDIALTISPIVGRDGRLIGASRIARDITNEQRARRQREELLEAQRQAREKAEDASRAKDEFLAMLGHELRNPLHAIVLAVGHLENAQVTREGAARASAIIARQAEHVTRLVDDLLDVKHATSGQIVLMRHPINLADCALQCVAVFRETGQLQHHVVQTDTEPVWVEADSARLVQVVTNLLNNALKYTPEGGRIFVRVSAENNDAVLRVEDDGAGISADFIPHIFDLFTRGEVTLDGAPGGLGVGLTLVKRLVELHGGRVEVHSDGPDKGSAFLIFMPRIPPPVSAQAMSKGLPEAARRRILIIEDHSDARESLRTLLELWRHEVYEAADGWAGVEAAVALQPQVALIDIGLPGLDGYEVARRLRATPACDQIVLIALTGYTQIEDRQKAMDAGFQGFVTKPVDLNRLMQLIATLSPSTPHSSRSAAEP